MVCALIYVFVLLYCVCVGVCVSAFLRNDAEGTTSRLACVAKDKQFDAFLLDQPKVLKTQSGRGHRHLFS